MENHQRITLPLARHQTLVKLRTAGTLRINNISDPLRTLGGDQSVTNNFKEFEE